MERQESLKNTMGCACAFVGAERPASNAAATRSRYEGMGSCTKDSFRKEGVTGHRARRRIPVSKYTVVVEEAVQSVPHSSENQRI